MQSKINILLCVWVNTLYPSGIQYHPFFKGGRVRSRNSFWRGNIGVNTTYTPNHLEDLRDGYLCSRLAPGQEIFSFLFIHFIMVTFINYLFNYLPWTPLYLFLLTFY